MTIIKALPEHIVNQIAAGEIVHNPALVLKELLENAVDSGCTKIQVAWRYAGKSYLSVTDNGTGMVKEDLQICMLPHTTSKLDPKDLLNIQTFGFRGEALASIASVARLTITTKYHANRDQQGYRWSNIEPNAHQIIEYESLPGTSIEVKDLFYNVPARMHFLKSDQQESSKLTEIFKTFALSYPSIEFILQVDGKQKYHYPSVSHTSSVSHISDDAQHNKWPSNIQEYRDRIVQVFGNKLQDQLFYMEETWDQGYVLGIFSKPVYYLSSKSHLFYFVNHRMVQDKSFPFMVRAIYGDLLPKQAYPFGMIMLHVKPYLLNVHVHPNKLEVQFRKHFFPLKIIGGLLKRTLIQHSRSVTDHMVGKLEDRMQSAYVSKESSTLRRMKDHARAWHKGTSAMQSNDQHRFANAMDSNDSNNQTNAISSIKQPHQNFINTEEGHNHESCNKISVSQKFDKASYPGISKETSNDLLNTQKFSNDQNNTAPHPTNPTNPTDPTDPSDPTHSTKQPELYGENALGGLDTIFEQDTKQQNNEEFWKTPYQILGQIFRTFILGSTTSQFFIIDQHALHERILFEKLKKQYSTESLGIQDCLVPLSVLISQEDADLLKTHQEDMKNMGITLKFSCNKDEHHVMIQTWPSILSYPNMQQVMFVIGSVCDMLRNNLSLNPRLFMNQVLGELACSMAIYAGQSLKVQEMDALIQKIEDTPNIARCNHGRPTYMIISNAQLRRIFERNSK